MRSSLLLAAFLATAWFAATSPAATHASGCGSTATSRVLSLTVDGHARLVIVHVPVGYTGNARVPLVLNLHGSGSTAKQQEKFSAMDAAADAHHFLVAYPQGLIPEGSGFDWNVPGAPLVGGRKTPAAAADDISFITKLVSELERRYCIDSRMVFAVGFSGGSRLVSALACDDSGVFAAVGIVSGLRHPQPCPATRPVPIVAFHGTADPVDPYGGHGQAYWTYSVPTAERDWADEEHCATTPLTSHPAQTVELVRYARCRDRSTVELYTISGEGHEWPGGPSLPAGYVAVLGAQSNAIDADAIMWSFFAAHRL
ncbi:MAG: alpha/beta hydrolase family esterase [Gaiellaceae bacterium]